jgi:hypothetical protein
MRQREQVWPALAEGRDERLVSHLLHLLGPLEIDWRIFAERLNQPGDAALRSFLLLALGETTGGANIPEPLLQRVTSLYETDPDPAVHAAAEWLLRRWEQTNRIAEANKHLTPQAAESLRLPAAMSRSWYVNSIGGTMVVVPPGETQMGSLDQVGDPKLLLTRHRRRVPRWFAIAAKETSVAELKDFRAELQARGGAGAAIVPDKIWPDPIFGKPDTNPPPDQAANFISWYEAAAFCNWLTRRELSEEQVCFEEILDEQGRVVDFRIPDDCLSRLGYRLPTEAEWEYACRAGTMTRRYYGDDDSGELLNRYAFYGANSDRKPQRVGLKQPNAWGLFDMYGNMLEWSLENDALYPLAPGDAVVNDVLCSPGVVEEKQYRVMRGGNYYHPASDLRSDYRQAIVPGMKYPTTGFRVSRTIAAEEGAPQPTRGDSNTGLD